MSEFETIHRELRAAEEATRGASLGMSVTHVAASEALWRFRDRTGPLEDDVVAAAREMLKFGEHEGICEHEDDKCIHHSRAFNFREAELAGKLAALDEAARG